MSLTDPTPQNPVVSMSNDIERVLVVHAHPDDETIATGALLATLVDDGARVTVVTCTRGELGEVLDIPIPAQELAALRADPAALAVHRQGELAAAMRELGVSDHRFLGAEAARTPGLPVRAYRDSGMEWGADGMPIPVIDVHPAAFCSAPFGEIVSDLAAVIADVHPTAIVSYDADGGYGHPDHVRTHRAVLRAARLAGVPFYAITGGTAHPGAELVAAGGDLVVDGTPVLDRKVAALGEYRSQVTLVSTPGGPALEFPHGAIEPVTVVETFRHVPDQADEPPAFPGLGGPDELGPLGKGVTLAASLVVGALFGAIGTVAHQEAQGALPYGVIIALAMVAALLVGFRLQFSSRLAGVLAAVGIVGIIGLLSLPQSSGTVLIPGNALGYTWLFGPTLIALVVLAWPRFPARQGDRIAGSPQRPQAQPDAKEQTSP
ncbi:N-acetyl-1-D-myo-inositol-2-amino-2-deoxy-alpha-D-glucopyranoside deacetylase [Frondihabitans sp. PhB188]|uniref:PIG-L family deacetylase n=1 Tax=Frondihabitans sp. PhB188 TaxID=2485200 RepID=UPI000FB42829|nr:PIG-L family deacetylase [Frondihabitans sp. PhB188]ROQ38452.1 N-acetyl-1-D-myo-inositol-2-amino-2-deoxy-alpha-D-glucopyranoside deacetylase [Frondihabitans sp. PhB188]